MNGALAIFPVCNIDEKSCEFRSSGNSSGSNLCERKVASGYSDSPDLSGFARVGEWLIHFGGIDASS
jgi:hypothetical protein